MRLKRWSAVVIGAVALIVVLVLAGGSWLVRSERGAQWALATVLERIPSFTVGSSTGTLDDEITLRDVTVMIGRDRVTIAEVRLRLRIGALLGRVLLVESLRATPVTYTRAPREPQAGRRARFELPIAIEIESASLDALIIEARENRLVLDATSFRASLAGNRVALEDIVTESQAVRMTGRGDVGFGPPLDLSTDIDWSTERGGQALSGHLALDGALPELDVRHALIVPFDITADGKLWVEATPRIDMRVEWRNVAAPDVDLESPSGSATLIGQITALEYDSAGVVNAYGRSYDYTAAGTLNGAVVAFAPLTVTAPSGTLSAQGEIDLDSLQWSATLAGRGLDVGTYVPAWPGSIDLNADARGRLGAELEVRADTIDIVGSLRGHPFTLAAAGAFEAPSRLSIATLDADVGGDTLQARGTVDDRIDLALTADVRNLENLWPDLAGALAADVRVTGTVEAPRVSGRVDARELALGEYAIANAAVVGSLATAPDADVDLDVVASGITLGGLDVASARAVLDGTPRAHAARFEARASRWSSELTARGGIDARRWVGAVEAARVAQAELGEWRLQDPAALELARDRIVLETSCLTQAGADLCAAARVVGQADDEVVVSARNFDLEALEPFFPDGVTLTGIYQLAANLQDPVGNPHGRVALTGGATYLHADLGADQVIDSALQSVVFGADLEEGRLDVRLDVDGGEMGRVNMQTTVDDVRDPSSRVQGELDVLWTDLSVLSLVSPDIGAVSGRVAMELDLGGTVAEPAVAGRGELSNGVVEVPAWGLRVEGIQSTATTIDGTTLEYSGSGLVDGQQLRVRGSTALEPGLPTRLALEGDSVHVVQLADADIFVSPDLDIDVALPDITVTGKLHVPSALITLDQLPSQAQRPSADSVVHGIEEAAPVRPINMQADIMVTLGDDVRYNGSNLESKLAGGLDLDYQSGRPAMASGSLTLAGTYNAYGQVLQLGRGELLFAGPVDDPTIDVRAERKIEQTALNVDEITVGVALTGRLKAPLIRIYSNPAMTEADALSYLMFGRPLSGTGEQETATLESAAVSMGLLQALPAVQRIGSSLGLDELSIQSTDVDAGALMAGKYLSPKLYVRYTYGLFNRIGGFLVRYRFNDRFSLETRSGDEESMDLFYTVEKN